MVLHLQASSIKLSIAALMARLKPYSIEKTEVVATASDGYGIVKHDARVVFVPYTVPGDIVDVAVFRKKRKLLFGEVTAMHTPSEHRIAPRCQHFGLCGGCKWQMMNYETQLSIKEQQVVDAFARIGKVDPGEVKPILGVDEPWYYRNKLEFTFSAKPWLTREQIDSGDTFDEPALGFHVPGFFQKVFTVETCYLQTEKVNDIRNAVHRYAVEKEIPFYDVMTHKGFLRQLMFRTSEATGECMLVLVVGEDKEEIVSKIFTHLEKIFPEAISAFVWIVSDKKNSTFTDLDFRVWKGESFITEKLDRFSFRISPTSFFQTNPKQAEKLYSVVREALVSTLPEGQTQWGQVYDLYAGTGSIGIYISDYAEKVVGVEYVQAAIDDAHLNVALNDLADKFSFYAGDMKKLLDDALIEKHGRPDVVIVDPPRAGMDVPVVEQLRKMAAPFIIYVSCKPATQARDVALLEEDYEVVWVQPVDMFPHTAHVENVALLRRRN